MIRDIALFFIVVFFTACSFEAKPNDWQYNSINAFSSYTKNFLRAHDALAKNDFKRAVSHAKNSANLQQLSRIYLGECALNISVGIQDDCAKYVAIADLVEDDTLNAYYRFITTTITLDALETLEPNYQKFARFKIDENYEKAIAELFTMKKITSKLLSATLVREHLSYDDVEKLVNLASFYGYKKSVLFWLNIQKTKTTEAILLRKIDKKIKIMGK